MEEYQFSLFVKYEGEAEDENLVQILYKYFSLKGKSGGGDCQVFQINPDLFCVSFKSEQGKAKPLQLIALVHVSDVINAFLLVE